METCDGKIIPADLITRGKQLINFQKRWYCCEFPLYEGQRSRFKAPATQLPDNSKKRS